MAGVLVFVCVVLAYLAYRYIDWQRHWQRCWRSVGLSGGDDIALSSTGSSTADIDEALLAPASSRARRAAASRSGDGHSRAVR